MERSLPRALDALSRGLLYLLFLLFPLFTLPIALDPLELNKQMLLVVLSVGAFLAWTGSMVARGKFSIRYGWVGLAPLLVLVATILSAARSTSPYLSWIGGSGQEYVSVLTVFALTLLYYVVLNRLDTERDHRAVHGLLVAGAVVTGGVGLFFAAQGQTFNTVGTVNALAVYLSALSVFGVGLFVASRADHALLHDGWLGGLEKAAVLVLLMETIALLLVLDYAVLWGVLFVGLTLLFCFFLLRAEDVHDSRRFVLPLLLMAVAALWFFWLPAPVRVPLPIEVTPSFGLSTRIAREALSGDQALMGSGPGTYAFDYARLHDASVNQTVLWSYRFDRGASFFHTVAPSFGVLGLFAWAAFFFMFFTRGTARVLQGKDYRDRAAVLVDLCGWSVFAAAAFFYPGNMTTVFFLFAFAALLASQTAGKPRAGTFAEAPKMAFVFTALVILCSVAILSVLFVGVRRYVSEAAVARAAQLMEAGADNTDVVMALDRAVSYNRFNDVAYQQLSQALLRETADVLATQPDLSTMTAEDRAYVQQLSAASVNAAVRATDLSAGNGAHWLSRGAVYREFIPLVTGAGDFAVDAFEQAAALEPLNPVPPTELGKTYLALAQAMATLAAGNDAAIAADAETKRVAYLAAAETAFNAAAVIKADYAPTHYQLAVTYEQQGRLDDAIGKMESVRAYNALDVGVTFQLGLLYARRGDDGDLARAQAAFERAIELVPTYANARWFLASIYESQGNREAAVEQIERVLQYNPENTAVKQRLERLRNGEATIGDAVLAE